MNKLNKKQIEFCDLQNSFQGVGNNVSISKRLQKEYLHLLDIEDDMELMKQIEDSNSGQWWFYKRMKELEE